MHGSGGHHSARNSPHPLPTFTMGLSPALQESPGLMSAVATVTLRLLQTHLCLSLPGPGASLPEGLERERPVPHSSPGLAHCRAQRDILRRGPGLRLLRVLQPLLQVHCSQHMYPHPSTPGLPGLRGPGGCHPSASTVGRAWGDSRSPPRPAATPGRSLLTIPSSHFSPADMVSWPGTCPGSHPQRNLPLPGWFRAPGLVTRC